MFFFFEIPSQFLALSRLLLFTTGIHSTSYLLLILIRPSCHSAKDLRALLTAYNHFHSAIIIIKLKSTTTLLSSLLLLLVFIDFGTLSIKVFITLSSQTNWAHFESPLTLSSLTKFKNYITLYCLIAFALHVIFQLRLHLLIVLLSHLSLLTKSPNWVLNLLILIVTWILFNFSAEKCSSVLLPQWTTQWINITLFTGAFPFLDQHKSCSIHPHLEKRNQI